MSEEVASIERRTRRLLAEVPAGITVVAAAKTRDATEIHAAIAGGARIVGHNYVQEAHAVIEALGRDAATWHMIGHLQRNKAKDAVRLFDAIQTVDSLRLAERIDRECSKIRRIMPILIEVNSGREPQKKGVPPEETVAFVRELADLRFVRIEGVMTMGPLVADPEELRPIFRETKRLFDELARLALPDVQMETLSMGMSDSYRVAIEEGATMIRLGTVLFGPRHPDPVDS
jgi:pyridoxal phosphate enzyme (YggS family)